MQVNPFIYNQLQLIIKMRTHINKTIFMKMRLKKISNTHKLNKGKRALNLIRVF